MATQLVAAKMAAKKSEVKKKLSEARESLQASPSSNDPESPQDPQKSQEEGSEEREPLLTWNDLLTNPCLFVPIVILSTGGVLGVIMFLVHLIAKLQSYGADLVVSLFLCVSGLIAAFEIRSLGSLADQIAYLKVLRKHLEASTDQLTSQVGGITSENKELEENVKEFRTRNDELKSSVTEFDTKNEELRSLQSKLEEESAQLKAETNAIRAQNDKLAETVTSLSSKHDELTNSLKAFDELRGHLNSIAEEQGEQIQDLIAKTGDTFAKMDRLVADNEQVLLNQLAADVEMIDQDQGLSEKEFKRYCARLPKRYKELIKAKGISFQTYDSDGSGVIEPQELLQMVESLTSEVMEKEKRRRK